MDNGKYLFRIDDDLLDQMQQAARKQKLTSKTINVCEIDWVMEFYPNGTSDNNAGNFGVYLTLSSFPEKWSSITLSYNIKCNGTLSSFSHYTKLTETDNSFGWVLNTMTLSEIQ